LAAPASVADMISVRAVGVDDWASWRELPLAALADAPHALTATLDQWREAAETRWRERLPPARCTRKSLV
jgi:hypothetical protein